jgi:DNA ligase D-like protein (predicted ligase)
MSQPMPDTVEPQLVSLADKPPAGSGDSLYEIKFDGYRMLARIEGAAVRLITRNGFDWTARMPALATSLANLSVETAWLDGEVVIQNDTGRPDFQALQSAFSQRKTAGIIFYVFDLMFLNGEDLRDQPVEVRRSLLAELLQQAEAERIRLSEAFDVLPKDMLASACEMKLEGLVAKRKGSRYRSDRSTDWQKLKCSNRQEFVIAGFIHATGGSGVGSLLLGLPGKDGVLRYAGRVKTGFSDKTLGQLRKALDGLESTATALADPPPRLKSAEVPWLRPVRVCDVKYAEITPSGKVRHAVYIGLREDKQAADVYLEVSVTAQSTTASRQRR